MKQCKLLILFIFVWSNVVRQQNARLADPQDLDSGGTDSKMSLLQLEAGKIFSQAYSRVCSSTRPYQAGGKLRNACISKPN